jgi:alkylation response protein AidB-like acyl-CoA dehydrogenase
VVFQVTSEQQRLQNKCRELASDFATRTAAHDRDASHPVENYDRLRNEGFLALTVGKEWGGLGASFLDHTIAYEVLGARSSRFCVGDSLSERGNEPVGRHHPDGAPRKRGA